MSWTSHENRESGVEHKKNAETVERQQITKHQHANDVKGIQQHLQGGQHIIWGVRPKESCQLTWRG